MPSISRRATAPLHPMVAIGAAAVAGAVHVAAGVFDAGHAVWRPGGHLSLYAVGAWLLAGLTAWDARHHRSAFRRLADVVLGLALLGLALLLLPA